jgi:hypothetical protein
VASCAPAARGSISSKTLRGISSCVWVLIVLLVYGL